MRRCALLLALPLAAATAVATERGDQGPSGNAPPDAARRTAGARPAGGAPLKLAVSSPAFRDQGAIPAQYTCEGRGSSPPLDWTGVPAEAKSLAIVVDDPDAPNGEFVHWFAYSLPPRLSGLPAGADTQLPQTSSVAPNSKGDTGYAPLCPPSGRHQ